MPRTKPAVSLVLQGEEGAILMVRAVTREDAAEIAHGEAAGDDYVVADPGSVALTWIRAVPCVPKSRGGHEPGGAWCEGGGRCHYVPWPEHGPGAFRGAFIDIIPADLLEDGDPREARYLAECAEMERRACPAPGKGEPTHDSA